ncbi:MAG: DVU0259 family response regulator domain-containing protein [Pseudomonadota bacterium]
MKKNILVIEDDIIVRDYLVSLLTDNGYDVHAAGNAKQGLEQAKKNIPDLITLDIEMPGEWGPRFYQKISKHPGLKKVPVIIISGVPGHQYAILKAFASVSKPFDREELLRIVRQALA